MMSNESINIQWFPGHMSKTRRLIKDSVKQCDGVVEIIDSRIPISSRNPELNQMISGKKRIILMNKCDMADKSASKEWMDFYKKQGTTALEVDCKTGKGLKSFVPTTRNLLKEEIDKWSAKGMKGRNIKVLVVGVPNVGKSSFINRMAKNTKAKVEDRPGVTQKNQWYSIAKGFDMLDTPGVLWPKFEDKKVGENLAFTGAIKDSIMDVEELAPIFIDRIKSKYGDLLATRYKMESSFIEENSGIQILQMIAKKRGMILPGNEFDLNRAANMLMNEFRNGVLGRITLETAE